MWDEVGESQLIGPELVQETTAKISQIKGRSKVAHDRQKSYADKRRKPLKFSVGDYVLLKVGPVAYQLDLPKDLNDVHDTFYVSNLKKYLADPTLKRTLRFGSCILSLAFCLLRFDSCVLLLRFGLAFCLVEDFYCVLLKRDFAQIQNYVAVCLQIRIEYQLADMFTKALPEDRFKYLVRRIRMRCLTPAELEVLAKEST
nr:putative reverse transcriptase domain-containing protein [Tanacetum cinerariifolium]